MPNQRPIDLPLPDARLLRLFDLLYSTRSVTRTAEHMGATQPSVSNWLRRLRHQLRDPLFVKTATGMQPTPRADEIIDAARAALEALTRLTPATHDFDAATAERTFHVCMTYASHLTLLPRLLARIRELSPRVRLKTSFVGPASADELRSGEVDLALGLVSGLDAGFYQQSLFTQDWICMTRQDHPRIGAELSLEQYRAEQHINISHTTGLHILENALKASGVRRNIILEAPGFLGLSGIVGSTDLIATVPRHVGEALIPVGNMRAYPCPVPIPPFTVKQHWHGRYHNDPANRWLRAQCAHLFLQARGRLPE